MSGVGCGGAVEQDIGTWFERLTRRGATVVGVVKDDWVVMAIEVPPTGAGRLESAPMSCDCNSGEACLRLLTISKRFLRISVLNNV